MRQLPPLFTEYSHNPTKGGDKHCEAMHFQIIDLTFNVLPHTCSKVTIIFILFFLLLEKEIERDLSVT